MGRSSAPSHQVGSTIPTAIMRGAGTRAGRRGQEDVFATAGGDDGRQAVADEWRRAGGRIGGDDDGGGVLAVSDYRAGVVVHVDVQAVVHPLRPPELEPAEQAAAIAFALPLAEGLSMQELRAEASRRKSAKAIDVATPSTCTLSELHRPATCTRTRTYAPFGPGSLGNTPANMSIVPADKLAVRQ